MLILFGELVNEHITVSMMPSKLLATYIQHPDLRVVSILLGQLTSARLLLPSCMVNWLSGHYRLKVLG